MAYRAYNPNPLKRQVGDCTVRAISKAMDADWERTYIDLALQGLMQCDMPSANSVWGAYLRSKGMTRNVVANDCPDCYCVADFAHEHPRGIYVLALSGHVVCVIDGDWYDSWDCGGESPIYYWERSDT